MAFKSRLNFTPISSTFFTAGVANGTNWLVGNNLVDGNKLAIRGGASEKGVKRLS
jgi:hypothetical protein